jgi:RNA polymerase subunit RPABC4/transcription elongation factor Spt4
MSKLLASKKTKEILSQTEVGEQGRAESEFSTSWQGRITFIDTDKSRVAKEMGVTKPGDYAIKVR